jgi:hypothetical protein
MKSIFLEVEWVCPFCYKETDIFVEAESPSDYYPDTFCEHCGKEIHSEKLDDKILKEVSEAWSSE